MIRLLGELLAFSLLALIVLAAVLVGGQAVKVGDLLFGPAGPAPGWPRALGLAALVLLEAALPLVALVACGLVYGRQRAEGAALAWRALGASPLLGVGLGLLAGWLAQAPVPRAVRALGGVLQAAAAHQLAATEGTVALPGGGAARRGGAEVWAVLPTAGGPPTILRAEALTLQGDAASTWRMMLERAWLWGPRLRVRAGEAHLRLDDAALRRRLGMLGPPNDRPSTALPATAHVRFTAHRRRALPAMAPAWALLGAVLGARFGAARAVAGAGAAVAVAYWLLRVGELSARAGFMAPWLAAWAPALVLALALTWAATRGAFD